MAQQRSAQSAAANQAPVVWPALLLPVRIETRRIDHQLCIRVFPDQPFVDSHRELLTKEEHDHGIPLHAILSNGDLDDPVLLENARGEWKELARRYGTNRAAWILDRLNHAPDAAFAASPAEFIPRLHGLPDRFTFLVYKDDQVAYEDDGNVIPPTLPLLPAITTSTNANTSATGNEKGLYDDASKWINDFSSAIDVGLGIRFDLREEHLSDDNLKFSQVVVVGLRPGGPDAGLDAFSDFVESHHYTDGFEFLYETPTNNTGSMPSGHSESDEQLLASFDVEVLSATERLKWDRRESSASGQLETALGLPVGSELLAHIKAAELGPHLETERLLHALWPSTGDYFFSAMLGLEKRVGAREMLQIHTQRFLRPRGPLATLRVGNLPFGVLPVSRTRPQSSTDTTGWKSYKSDSPLIDRRSWLEFDENLFRTLSHLLPLWRTQANDSSVVPRAGESGDPDEEIMKLLGMAPHSLNHRARPVVDHNVIGILMRLLWPRFGWYSKFGEFGNEQVASAAWIAEKDRITAGNLQLLTDMGAPPETSSSALLRAFAWGGSQELDMSLVRNKDDLSDGPERYLPLLVPTGAQPAPGGSQTLLYDILRRSLATPGGLPQPSGVVADINWLHDLPVLEFFNVYFSPTAFTALWAREPALAPFEDEQAWRDFLDALSARPFADVQAIKDVFGADSQVAFDNVASKLHTDFTPRFEAALRDVIDALTYRLDAWFTTLPYKRLHAMHAQARALNQAAGIHWGAYGYVEDLSVPPQTTQRGRPAVGGGFIHAPSIGQATAAALLRSAFDSHRGEENGNPYALNLTSSRVRRAQAVMEGIQQGQELSALLGYQLERALHDHGLDRLIDDFRLSFPIAEPPVNDEASEGDEEPAESIPARNVTDGRAVVAASLGANPFAEYPTIKGIIEALDSGDEASVRGILADMGDTADAVGDVLVYEGIFQSVQGNFERSGAALDACAGLARPPETESIGTSTGGINVRHRVSLFLPCTPTPTVDSSGERAAAEPRFNAWVSSVVGLMSSIGSKAYITPESGVEGAPLEFTLADLVPKVSALDFMYMCGAMPSGSGDTEIEIRMRRYVRFNESVAENSTIRLALDEAPAATKSLNDAIEVGRALLDILGNAIVMDPGAVTHPDDAPQDTTPTTTTAASLAPDAPEPPIFYKAAEIGALWTRANAALQVMTEQAGHLEANTESQLVSALDRCASFGIQEALITGPADPSLQERRVRVLEVANKRIAGAGPLIGTTQLDDEASLPALRGAFQALFGESFLVFPPFDATGLGDKAADFASSIASPPGDDRVWLWLQQVADTHPRVRKLETMLMTAEAWGTLRDNAHFAGQKVAQLPLRAPLDGWQALSDSELNGTPGRAKGCQSIVAMLPNPFELSCLSGFVIDEWTETIPAKKVTTGVSFEYNQPSCQAPQCFLLCTPGNFDAPTWSAQHFAEIVRDTMDLAKVRLVDLDALPEVAAVFPALMFPISGTSPILDAGLTQFGALDDAPNQTVHATAHTASDAVSRAD